MGGGPCGTVSVEGQCAGSVLDYCDPGTHTLVVEDCSQVVPDGGEVYACQLINPAFGYDCAAPLGQSCLRFASQTQQVPWFCQGVGAGCVYGASGATCELNFQPCVGYDVDGGFGFQGAPANAAACSGSRLQIACTEDQPVAQDCAALGGACGEPDGGPACIGLAAGQPCDDHQFFCGSALRCANPDGGGYGYCS